MRVADLDAGDCIDWQPNERFFGGHMQIALAADDGVCCTLVQGGAAGFRQPDKALA